MWVALWLAAVAGFVATMAVLLFRMNLPWWGYLLGAGAAILVWSVTVSIGENKREWLEKRAWLGWILGPLNALSGIALLILAIVGVAKFLSN